MTTDIEWARNEDGSKGETWNPVLGCTHCSPGCDNCYAALMAARLEAMGQESYVGLAVKRKGEPAKFLDVLRPMPDRLDTPLRWRKPRTVFVNSMSDLWHKDVPENFIGSVWATMAKADRHTFQILTKRPQRMAKVLNAWADHTEGSAYGGPIWRDHDLRWNESRVWPLPNVWLGTSIELDRYTWRADRLRETPAAVRFLSLEPLLGPLPSLDLTGIDWCIVGGESGPGARPMHPGWARDIRDQCNDAGVPLFFKQWGAHAPMLPYLQSGGGTPVRSFTFPDGETVVHLAKKEAGRMLDGRTWDEMPGRVSTAVTTGG